MEFFKYVLDIQMGRNSKNFIQYFGNMFKFKRVDQEQELEEGEISDDNLQVPPSTNTIHKVQKKSKPSPVVDQQEGSQQEYVIEQVKIRPPSPYSDRKKERKELKADEKNYRYEKKLRPSRSPQNSNFQPLPVIQPIQPPQPVNPYYGYPPSNMYPYGQPAPDQRPMRYIHMGQPQPMSMSYGQNPYPQRMPMQSQWHTQVPVSPNKIHNPPQIPDYNQRQPVYGFNNPNPQAYPHNLNPNYPHINQYPNNTTSSMPMPQNVNQNYYQHNYNQQQQEYNKNYMQQQRRKQQQQQAKQKQRDKKIKEIRKNIKQKIFETSANSSSGSNSSINANEKDIVGQILMIIKSIIEQKEQKDEDIEAIHFKIEEGKLRSKIYDMLAELQMGNLIEKLKVKELENRLIEESKKKEAAEIFKKLARKDPRVRVS